MTRKLASHVERVRAVSGSLSGRLIAYAGFRDTDAVTHSSVHLLSASKLAEQGSVEVGSSGVGVGARSSGRAGRSRPRPRGRARGW